MVQFTLLSQLTKHIYPDLTNIYYSWMSKCSRGYKFWYKISNSEYEVNCIKFLAPLASATSINGQWLLMSMSLSTHLSRIVLLLHFLENSKNEF